MDSLYYPSNTRPLWRRSPHAVIERRAAEPWLLYGEHWPAAETWYSRVHSGGSGAQRQIVTQRKDGRRHLIQLVSALVVDQSTHHGDWRMPGVAD